MITAVRFYLRQRLSIWMAVGLGLSGWNVAMQAGPAGSLDTGFRLTHSVGNLVYTVSPQSDGNIVIGGELDTVAGAVAGPITRVRADGELDRSFSPPAIQSYNTLTDSVITKLDPDDIPVVFTSAIQTDGKILVGGSFFFIDGKPGYGGLIRLNADGSPDPDFNAPRFNGTVFSVVPLASGEIMVGGDFGYVGDVSQNCLARLKSDGTPDKTFKPGSFAGTPPASNPVSSATAVHSIVVQPDGKVVVGGVFTSIGGVSRRGVARLTKAGGVDDSFVLDAAFNPPSSIAGESKAYSVDQVLGLALQSDGKVIAVGSFRDPSSPTKDPTPINSVYRLNTNGSLDSSFNPNGAGTAFTPKTVTISNPLVSAVTLEPNGKIIIAGPFAGYNDKPTNLVARLNLDGTLDTSFDDGAGPGFSVNCLALQANGQLVIGGSFNLVDGVSREFVARLNTTAGVPPAVVVSIVASKKAYESGLKKGKFTITRSGGNPTGKLVIPIKVSGDAAPNVDYAKLPTKVVIRGGSNSVALKVIPTGTTLSGENKKVTVTLGASAAYGIGPASTATVVIEEFKND